MSASALPLLFINLGGEMLYILDQRLRAQPTHEGPSDKGGWSEMERRRVMSDVVGALFSSTFMEELLKPQPLYSHRTMKTVLTRLVHSSIMRLDPASMERLYELIIMAFKQQLLLCPRPKDLLLVSYNHLDQVHLLLPQPESIHHQLDHIHRRLIQVYSALSEAELQLLRQTLLVFLQDSHVRVSIFQKSGVQKPDGRFVLPTSGPLPHGIEVPGMIRMFDRKGREVRRSHFSSGGSHISAAGEGSFLLRGERIITLGTNMYTTNQVGETQRPRPPVAKQADAPNPLAKEELEQLARLLGSVEAEPPPPHAAFHIRLFEEEEEEEEEEPGAAGEAAGGAKSLIRVIDIQAQQDEAAAKQLAHIAGLFAEEPPEGQSSSRGDQLLALMDDL